MHLDVDTAKLPARIAQPLRRRPMRRLVVLVPLLLSLRRILPRLLEQHLIIHHSSSDRIRYCTASLHRDHAVSEGCVEFVEGEEGEKGGQD